MLKGIVYDFNLLMHKDCLTIDDIKRECRCFKEVKSLHVKQFVQIRETTVSFK